MDNKHIAIVTDPNPKKFLDAITNWVSEITERGDDFEIHYSTSMQSNNLIIYSALIIGRDKKCK